MSNLHALFALRNEQALARAIDASRSQATSQIPLSSSAGRSWTRSHVPTLDINVRDWLGRTVLHLACASTEPFALTCVGLLLAHPAINVNIQDTESRWTALHRALYAGNLTAAIMLLQREDTDPQLRDYDGHTAFDLYNSTIDGTAPDENGDENLSADLFTWGVNRNAALGHGDAADRTYPDQVFIQPLAPPAVTSQARFTPIGVKGISMAKLHTTVITDEPHGNLRVCGFGSGGRLGTGKHTQYSLQPVPQLTVRIIAVALGQDHTLALGAAGEVFSWGLNRFTQLGYTVEREEPVQATARKVLGLLRKEDVIGVAACRTASACWTRTDVFTWGTNSGQLGYDSAAQPVQVLPRKVTGVQRVTGLALTDSAMACLLETKDVICFRADAHFRVRFPAPDLADLTSYQHPHVVKPAIDKITSSDDVFAAVSSRGDIFTFAAPPPPSEDVPRPAIKPQRVWSLRKSFDRAKDLALGADGTLIICTESGHVFVRRPGAKALRIPLVHRIVRVCASSTGAFAGLRLTPIPVPVRVVGALLGEDLRTIRPWINSGGGDMRVVTSVSGIANVEDKDDGDLEADVETTARLCALLGEKGAPPTQHGADVLVHSAELSIPTHRTVLAARSSVLRGLLDGGSKPARDGPVKITFTKKGGAHITVVGCQPMSVLLLLEYIYTDDLPALWDRRVGGPCRTLLERAGVTPGVVKTQLEALARALDLPLLIAVLSVSTKLAPAPTLGHDMAQLFRESVSPSDVVLALADRDVRCHSVVLRARSPFFRGFFGDRDWTERRWPAGGVLVVDMKHMEWRVMRFVMAWMYWDEEDDLFENLRDVESVSELLDLVFAVIAVASELLLDKLMLICSSIILRHVTLYNVASLLADANYYNALELIDSLQAYIASNLEAILESHLLDDVQPDLIKALEASIRKQQTDKSTVTRTNHIVDAALHRHEAWLAMQDIPQPLVRSQRVPKESPRLSPVGIDKTSRRPLPPSMSPLSSPALTMTTKASITKLPYADEIFSMEDDAVPALNIGQPQSPPSGYTLPPPAWKSKSMQTPPRIDMKAIMAEAETGKSTSGEKSSETRVMGFDGAEQSSGTPKWSHKPSQRERRKLHAQNHEESPVEPASMAPTPSSPWKLASQHASSLVGPISISTQKPSTTLQSSATNRIPGPQVPSSAAISKRQPATPASILQSSSSALGPVFSPAIPSPLQRRTASDSPAWTKPAHDPIPLVDSGISFAAIQQQQRDQGQQQKGKRSLREIQQEERARQEEEDFLRWWTAEEQRLKAAADAQVQQTIAADVVSSKRGRGTRKSGRGSARGKGSDGPGRGQSGIPLGQ